MIFLTQFIFFNIALIFISKTKIINLKHYFEVVMRKKLLRMKTTVIKILICYNQFSNFQTQVPTLLLQNSLRFHPLFNVKDDVMKKKKV